MPQIFYTSVHKKEDKCSCKPIPLLKENFLSEFKTDLEKAKARKSLDIPEVDVNIYFTSDLDDDVEVPVTIGGISKGTKVSELRGRRLNDIIHDMLFPLITKNLEYPTLSFNIQDLLIKVGDAAQDVQLIFTQNDAGNVLSENITVTPEVGATYDTLGTYIYKGEVSYDDGPYIIDNTGGLTTKRVSAGTLSTSVKITTTYPWYVNGAELPLSKFNESVSVSLSLTGNSVIKLPGANTEISNFKLIAAGSEYDVNLASWTITEEELNGTTYKVYTKTSNAKDAVIYKLTFTLKA